MLMGTVVPLILCPSNGQSWEILHIKVYRQIRVYIKHPRIYIPVLNGCVSIYMYTNNNDFIFIIVHDTKETC